MIAKSCFFSSVIALTSLSLHAEESELQNVINRHRNLCAHTEKTNNSSKKNPEKCGKTPSPYRATVRHIEGKGIGYNKGYTSVDLFTAFAPTLEHRWVPFLDARLHVFDNGRIATNAGFGLRYIGSSCVYGINSYYDYRETSRQKYNQYALGLEVLGKVWDVRINGYLPVGSKHSDLYQTEFSHFSGHSIFLKSRREFAMKGINAESGIHFNPIPKIQMYGAFGAYYFVRSTQNAIGGKLRLSATFLDHIKMEASTSYDAVFRWIGQGELSFILPFGPKKLLKKKQDCSRSLWLRERAVQTVDRQEIIVTSNNELISTAINPATGQPWKVYFVDNTSHSLGTFESPFSYLSDAETASSNGDILYVFPGNGTTNHMDSGITLKPYQKLLSSGTFNFLSTSLGSITIPSQTTQMPVLSNETSGPNAIVTLSDYCEVAGFNLSSSNTMGYGIAGGDPSAHTSFVKSPYVHHNAINLSNVTHAGIGLNVSDNALVSNNIVTVGNTNAGIWINSPGDLQATLIENISAVNDAHVGILINSTGSMTVSCIGNTGVGLRLDDTGIRLSTTGGSIDATLVNNAGTGDVGGYGIYLSASEGINAFLSGNTGINIDTISSGIELDASAQPLVASLENNRGSGGAGNSAGIRLYAGQDSILATLIGNSGSVTGPGYGIALDGNGVDSISINSTLLENVGAAGTTGSGIVIGRPSSARHYHVTTTLENNTGRAGDSGYGIWIGGHEELTATLVDNVGIATTGYGINLKNNGVFSTAQVTLIDNTADPQFVIDNSVGGTFTITNEGNTPIQTFGDMILSN